MKTRVVLVRWGDESEDAEEFGYTVIGGPEDRYQNRGSLMQGRYFMEERSRNVESYSKMYFGGKGVVMPEGFEAVNLELYKRARTFAKNLVEKLTPEFVDTTPIGMKAKARGER